MKPKECIDCGEPRGSGSRYGLCVQCIRYKLESRREITLMRKDDEGSGRIGISEGRTVGRDRPSEDHEQDRRV